MPNLKPGAKYRSSTDATEVIIVKGMGDVDLRCGGAPVLPSDGGTGEGVPAAGFDGGTLMGKRYVAPDSSLELLVVRPGAGSLSIGDEVLQVKDATALPSSD